MLRSRRPGTGTLKWEVQKSAGGGAGTGAGKNGGGGRSPGTGAGRLGPCLWPHNSDPPPHPPKVH